MLDVDSNILILETLIWKNYKHMSSALNKNLVSVEVILKKLADSCLQDDINSFSHTFFHLK